MFASLTKVAVAQDKRRLVLIAQTMAKVKKAKAAKARVRTIKNW